MKLLEHAMIGNIELANRVVMEPMCMYRVDKHDGIATPFHIAHYGARAIGQVGLIIVEATGVSPEGRITDQCLGLYNDYQIPALKELVNTIHDQGGKVAIQLNHAGRKSTAIDKISTIFGPSAIAYNETSRTPVAVDDFEINRIINDFVSAARRAEIAGFDAIEIHGAHGYLVSQFMSPYSNKRDDAYQDGALFAQKLVAAIRSAWPKPKPLLFRISASDFEKEGLDVNEAVRILNLIKDDIDIINVSSGGITPTPPHSIFPGYQIGFAQTIRTQTQMPVIGCGMLGSLDLASYLLESNTVDFIGLARPLLANPNWVLDAAQARKVADIIPLSYQRGYKF